MNARPKNIEDFEIDASDATATWSGLTVFTPPKNHTTRKTITFDSDGNFLSKSGQQKPPLWWDGAQEFDCPNMAALVSVVRWTNERSGVLVHGGLVDGPVRGRLRKLGLNSPIVGRGQGNIIDRPTRIILIDLDTLPAVQGVRAMSADEIYELVIHLLPPEFRGVQCLLHFSSGHGAQDHVVKIHLVFLLDRPLVTKQRKQLLGECLTFQTKSGEKIRPVDPLPLGEAHFLNIVDAATVNAPDDYAKHRWFHIAEGAERVRVPDESELKRREKAGADFKKAHGGASGSGGRQSSGQGLADRPDGVGDWRGLIVACLGEGRTGHSAMRYAAFSYFSQFGPGADAGPFFEFFNAQIANLGLPEEDATRIIQDEKRHWEWIAATMRRKREPEAVDYEGPATVDLQTGRDICRQEIRRLFAHALRRKRSLAKTIPARAMVEALMAERKKVEKELEGVVQPQNAPPDPQGSSLVSETEGGAATLPEMKLRARSAALYEAAGRIGAAAGVTEWLFDEGGPWKWSKNRSEPPTVVIQGSVGLGKTETLIERLANARAWGLRAAFAVADHDLLGDIKNRLEKAFDELDWSKRPRPSVAVWRGEAAADPDHVRTKVCRRSTERGAVRAVGGDDNKLCSRGRGRKRVWCPHHPDNPARAGAPCSYIAQQAAVAEADIILIAGAAFLERSPNKWIGRPAYSRQVADPVSGALLGVEAMIQPPKVDLVILDEPAWAQLIVGADGSKKNVAAERDAGAENEAPRRLEMKLEEIEQLWNEELTPDEVKAALRQEVASIGADGELATEIVATPLAEKLAALVAATRRAVAIASAAEPGKLMTHGQLAEIISDRGAAGELRAKEFADLAWALCVSVAVAPDGDFEDWIAGDGAPAARWNQRAIWLARFFGAIGASFARHSNAPDDQQTGFLKIADIGPPRDRARGVQIRAAEKVHADWRIGAGLVLDATHAPLLAGELWPNLAQAIEIELEQPKDAAHVRQIYDASFSLTQVREILETPSRLKEIADFLEVEAAIVGGQNAEGADNLIIAPKDLKKALTAHWGNHVPEGVEFATWGKVRGQDRWKGAAAGQILSRMLPPPEALADLEAIITGAPSELQETAYVLEDATYRQNADRTKAWRLEGRQPRLRSAIAEELRQIACDHQSAQGVGRLRLNIRPNAKVRITVLSGAPIPGLCVDTLVTAESVLRRHPATVLAARGLAVVAASKGSAGVLGRAWGKSENAVDWELKDAPFELNASKGCERLYEIHYKGSHPFEGLNSLPEKRKRGRPAKTILFSDLRRPDASRERSAERTVELIGGGDPFFAEVVENGVWAHVRIRLNATDRYAAECFVRGSTVAAVREVVERNLGQVYAITPP